MRLCLGTERTNVPLPYPNSLPPSCLSTIIVIKVEWLGNPLLLAVFVSFFGPDRAQRSIAFLSF